MALSIQPSCANALHTRGFVNLKIGQPNGHCRLRRGIADQSRQAASHFGRGVAKIKSGDVASAMRDISAAKTLQANIAGEFATLGIR
jgi:hypothetical protein